jgi:hypothetical protein
MEGLTDTSKTINDESASGSANQSSAANSLGKIYNLILCLCGQIQQGIFIILCGQKQQGIFIISCGQIQQGIFIILCGQIQQGIFIIL